MSTFNKLTIQEDNSTEAVPRHGGRVLQEVATLEGVQEGNPGQVTKTQHEAKAFVDYVHCCQYGILEWKRITYLMEQVLQKMFNKVLRNIIEDT